MPEPLSPELSISHSDSSDLSSKRQQLIETAFRLFYRNGIHAVGINQILKESGIAKKTLYHHFSGKEALLLAVLKYRDECFLQWLSGRMEETREGLPALEVIFDALDDWFNNRVDSLMHFQGCFFINTCGEFGDLQHEVHQQCTQHKTAVEQLVRRQVNQLEGITYPEQLTQNICQLKDGAIVQAHVQGDTMAALRSKKLIRPMVQWASQVE
ncbi:TetR/AcrR family transcriptional regulator [Oceanospirillum sediminis]|uniref:TetR/AcrR family transcriptional regulator n=1 Tax=Oceanospirillum sediminis TaxID=2760088 RepID=A0A839INV7_9GAMM|nr:TetR/AcrR family transcriptional regulator [Oceanospirillum sediminis]MBB1485956.1 TetR/AcrR family transcriptional regulator [Oceanospirillum sediminis]